MNRVAMCSDGVSKVDTLKMYAEMSCDSIARDLDGIAQYSFQSAPDGSPLMVTWDPEFEEWDVYYHE